MPRAKIERNKKHSCSHSHFEAIVVGVMLGGLSLPGRLRHVEHNLHCAELALRHGGQVHLLICREFSEL